MENAEAKTAGKSFKSRRFLKRRECVFDHTIIIHDKCDRFLQGFCKN
nr:MAG TPA: hypothetical protein [Bacteriophage sp.]